MKRQRGFKVSARLAILSLLLLTAFIGLPASSVRGAANTISINKGTTFQSIWGFGGAATWDVNDMLTSMTPQTQTAILDKLFRTDNDNAGLSIVRLEIQPYQRNEVAPVEWHVQPAPNVLATFMPANGVFDWDTDTAQRWFATQANLRASDVHYLAVPWSPPGWMKTNNSPTNGGSLRTDMINAFATYLQTYVDHYRKVFGIDIRWVSIQNEPSLSTFYASSQYSGSLFSTAAIAAADAIHSLNPDVMVGGPEQPTRGMSATFLDSLTATARAKLDFVITHDYGGADTSLQRFGKPVFDSEVWSEAAEDTSVNDAIRWSNAIKDALNRGEPGWMYWWLLEPMNKNTAEGLINLHADGSYSIQRRLYAIGQFSRWMRMGDTRIQASSTNGNLGVVAAKDSTGRAAIVVINGSTTAVTSDITGLTGSRVSTYRTSATENLAHLADVTITGGTAANLTFPAQSITTLVEATGPTPTPSITPTASKTSTPQPAGTVRIEAGGTANFTDHNGNAWLADTGFTGGGVVDRGNIAIANTLDPRIYQTEHYGITSFAYTVPNGTYQVNLHFAETYTGITGAGQRVFSVNVEGTAINNIDVYAQAGGANTALIKTVNVTVADGQLNLTFAATVNNAEINGIEIIPTSATPTPTTGVTFQPPTNTLAPSNTPTFQPPTNTSIPPTATNIPNPAAVRIEAGGTANFTDHSGNVWIAETGFTGGGVVDRGNIAIANTLDPRIYQTEHYGMTAFAYTVPNGTYQVNLHFAETYTGITGAGQRVFNMNVEGTAINNIDVFAQAGGINKALIKTVNVTVADGQLTLTFAATVNNPEINGIEILPVGPVPTATNTATSTNTPVPSSTPLPSSTPIVTNTPSACSTCITARIEAGGTANFTDHSGNVWIAETGFTGGGVVDRGNIAIANTLDPRIYQTEHYGMTAFAYTVPNGTYQVNLHFAETYTGITGAGQRVFNVNVEGTAINNIDVFAQADGINKALIKTVNVTVADGQLNLTFAATVNNPEINGIEILPATSTVGGIDPSYQGVVFHDSVYAGSAQQIPGRVQLEYYDLGGENVAYHDSDNTNSGSCGLNPCDGTYLNTFRHLESADTSYTKFGNNPAIDDNPYVLVTQTPNQLYLGWTVAGEWTKYTVNVQEAGTYSINLMYTNPLGGTFSFASNGKDLTGPITPPLTFNAADPLDWRNWHHWNKANDIARVQLQAGLQVLTLNINLNGNFDYAEFVKVS